MEEELESLLSAAVVLKKMEPYVILSAKQASREWDQCAGKIAHLAIITVEQCALKMATAALVKS